MSPTATSPQPVRGRTARETMTDAQSLSCLADLSGKFLAFEGPDGSGKSTQLSKLIEAFTAAGVPVCQVREPGGTQVGEQIRSVLLDRNSEMTLHCEMLLYMASRAQLVEERIRPALARGEVVIADRFVSSTYAYQGTAGGVPEAHIHAVADVALRGTVPDVVFIFDVDSATAAKRTRGVEKVGRRKVAPAAVSLFADRIEQRGDDYHGKVREGYLAQAKAEPSRHIVVDATKSPEDVWAEFAAKLAAWTAANKAR
ncbi:MAG: dTMP kinase [Planctomycetes bacterium]|nr:dTMP kinase [Planctomycetota bacterium]